MYWPASTMNAPHRTPEQWMNIVQTWDDIVYEDDCEGIKGPTPLTRLKDFNIIQNVKFDYMHTVLLGVAKKLYGVLMGITAKKTTTPMNDAVSKLYNLVKLPSEFSRRTPQHIRHKQFKSQQWKALALVGIGIVHDVVDAVDGRRAAGHSRIWLLFAYITRVLLMPNNLYVRLGGSTHLQPYMEEIYRRFENCLGSKFCVHNVHQFYHAPFFRDMRSFCETTTEPFEDSYGKIAEYYAGGTYSVELQFLRKVYLNLKYRHKCKKSLKHTTRSTEKSDDTLFYTHDLKFFKIADIDLDDKVVSFTAHPIRVGTWRPPAGRDINWAGVGVVTLQEILPHTVMVAGTEVAGKAAIAGDLLVALSEDMLIN